LFLKVIFATEHQTIIQMKKQNDLGSDALLGSFGGI